MISLQPYSSDYQQSDLEQSASLLQQNPKVWWSKKKLGMLRSSLKSPIISIPTT